MAMDLKLKKLILVILLSIGPKWNSRKTVGECLMGS